MALSWWNASSGATSYNVKRATVSGGPYTTTTNCTAILYMDLALAAGTYYYVVSARNADGESANSTEASAIVDCAVTPAPTGLAATVQKGQVLLAWSPVSTGTSPTTCNAGFPRLTSQDNVNQKRSYEIKQEYSQRFGHHRRSHCVVGFHSCPIRHRARFHCAVDSG